MQNLSDHDFDLLRSLKVKCNGAIDHPICRFLLMFNSNIRPSKAPLGYIRFKNLHDLGFDLSRWLKVKCNGGIELPIYGLLLMFNSNIWPNMAPLQDITPQNATFKVNQG